MTSFKRNNRVLFAFFVAFILVGVFLVNSLGRTGNKEIKKNVAAPLQANDLSNSNTIAIDSSKFNFVPAKGTPVVLGCYTSGCQYLKKILYQPVCTEGSGKVVVGDGQKIGSGGNGVKVQKNSRIEIVEITAPIALLSGSKYVENDLMAIWNADKGMNGTFKPSYAMISPDEAGMNLSPGFYATQMANIYDNRKTNNFAVNVDIKTDGEDSKANDPNSAIINQALTSVCPDIQKSDPNPDFPNKVAPDLTAQDHPPGQVSFARAYGGNKCYSDNPNGTTLPYTDLYKTCVTDFKPFAFIDFATIAVDKWAECTIPHKGVDEDGNPITIPADPTLCEDSVLYGLRIDAIFGTPYNENKHENTNFYLDTKVQAIAPPGEAKAMLPKTIDPEKADPTDAAIEPFYVTTNCKVRVDGRATYTVPCLWDVSAYQRDYQRQKQSAMPGEPNIPATFEEYWENVESQIAQRELQCLGKAG